MGSKPLIANELLAFIQNAIDTMDEVSIVQICKSNFKEEDVSSGKLLLFQTLGKAAQMPSHRRDGGVKSLQEIITLMKETDPDDVPAFVARELHKLPPVNFDHVDVTRLLKDINSLKMSLAELNVKLEASDKTISDLRNELLLIRNSNSLSRSPGASNVNTMRGAQNASVCSFASAEFAESRNSPPAAAAAAAAAPAPPRPAPRAESSPVVRTPPPAPQRDTPPASARAYATAAASRPAPRQPCADPPAKGVISHKEKNHEEGFVTVERRKRKKPTKHNKCGTAPACQRQLLRAAIPTTLMYVSRVHYSVKVEEVAEYLCAKTKFNLRVERLESRHRVNFNSFVVRVPTEHLSTFMKEELWPAGVMFRKFRGRLPAAPAPAPAPASTLAQQRITSQSLRV